MYTRFMIKIAPVKTFVIVGIVFLLLSPVLSVLFTESLAVYLCESQIVHGADICVPKIIPVGLFLFFTPLALSLLAFVFAFIKIKNQK